MVSPQWNIISPDPWPLALLSQTPIERSLGLLRTSACTVVGCLPPCVHPRRQDNVPIKTKITIVHLHIFTSFVEKQGYKIG